jgi:hypothetical protein
LFCLSNREHVTVPFDKIKHFVGQYVQNGTQPTLSFGLVPDEKIVFSDYAAGAAAGQVTRIPAIISNCANEMSALYPYPVDNLTAGPYKPAVLALDVTLWVFPTANTTVLHNALGIPVFRSQNTGTYPNLNPLRWLGAYHASDLPIDFGTYCLLTDLSPTTPFEVAVSLAMQDHILAFCQGSSRWATAHRVGAHERARTAWRYTHSVQCRQGGAVCEWRGS